MPAADDEKDYQLARNGPAPNDWRPRPDPTALTTAQLHEAISQLRELIEARLAGMDRATQLLANTVANGAPVLALRELLESRLAAMDKATELLAATVGKVPSDTDKAVDALRQLLGARIDGMDTATRLLAESVSKFPSDMDRAVSSLRELIENQIANVAAVAQEKFTAIEGTFASNALALTAALAAQKEAAAEQNKSNTLAIAKSEKAQGETTLANAAQTEIGIKALGGRVDDLKDQIVRLGSRLDRGEGQAQGGQVAGLDTRATAEFAQTAEIARQSAQRTSISIIVAVVSVLVSLIVAGVLVAHGG